MSRITAAIRAFGAFWVDFLVGDTPEFFVGTLVVIGAAFALRHERAAAIVVIPLLVLAILAAGTFRSRVRE